MTARILNIDQIAEHSGPHLPSRPVERSVRVTPTSAAAVLAQWVRRSRQRTELRRVMERDSRFFLDIGISRATVYNESRKWFWQA